MFLVLCSCPPAVAPAVARAVVEGGLAACVSLSSTRSVYRWQGEVCDADEVTLTIKVSAEGVDSLRARLVELHPYDVPEVLVLSVDVQRSHGPYVDWVRGGE